MITVEQKDNAGFLVDMVGAHRIELKKLASYGNNSLAVTLEWVIDHGLAALLKDSHK